MASVRITYGFVSHLKRSLSNNNADNPQNKRSPHRSYRLGKKGKAGIAVAMIAVVLDFRLYLFPQKWTRSGNAGKHPRPKCYERN